MDDHDSILQKDDPDVTGQKGFWVKPGAFITFVIAAGIMPFAACLRFAIKRLIYENQPTESSQDIVGSQKFQVPSSGRPIVPRSSKLKTETGTPFTCATRNVKLLELETALACLQHSK